MILAWTDIAWEDYLYWQMTDEKMLQRINVLIKEIKRSPFQGIGKPEPLKFELTGKWSRRINEEHRIVYEINGKKEEAKNRKTGGRVLVVHQCKYHY